MAEIHITSYPPDHFIEVSPDIYAPETNCCGKIRTDNRLRILTLDEKPANIGTFIAAERQKPVVYGTWIVPSIVYDFSLIERQDSPTIVETTQNGLILTTHTYGVVGVTCCIRCGRIYKYLNYPVPNENLEPDEAGNLEEFYETYYTGVQKVAGTVLLSSLADTHTVFINHRKVTRKNIYSKL